MKMNVTEANSTFMSDGPPFSHSVTALFGCNVLVCLPPNVYVVWLIANKAGGSLASEIFAFNLSMSEVHCCLLSLYMVLHILLRMPLDLGFLAMQCVLQVMFISRPVFQSCVCLERYLAVMHPTVFLRFKPLRYRFTCCVLTWLLILVYSAINVFTLSVEHMVYMQLSVSLSFLLLFSYVGAHVLYVLRQPRPGDGDRDHESRSDMKRKVCKIITTTLVFTSATHILEVLITGSMLFDESHQSRPWAVLLSVFINIIGGLITPLLYLHRAGKLPRIKVKHNGLILEMNHPTAGRVAVPGPAVRYSSFSPGKPTPPPLIGQHTVQVLRHTLSYGDDVIRALLESGAVAQNEEVS